MAGTPPSDHDWINELIIPVTTLGVQMANLTTQVGELKKDLNERLSCLEKDLAEQYVTQQEFRPVKLIAFGLVGLITVAVVTAILSLVINKRLPGV